MQPHEPKEPKHPKRPEHMMWERRNKHAPQSISEPGPLPKIPQEQIDAYKALINFQQKINRLIGLQDRHLLFKHMGGTTSYPGDQIRFSAPEIREGVHLSEFEKQQQHNFLKYQSILNDLKIPYELTKKQVGVNKVEYIIIVRVPAEKEKAENFIKKINEALEKIEMDNKTNLDKTYEHHELLDYSIEQDRVLMNLYKKIDQSVIFPSQPTIPAPKNITPAATTPSPIIPKKDAENVASPDTRAKAASPNAPATIPDTKPKAASPSAPATKPQPSALTQSLLGELDNLIRNLNDKRVHLEGAAREKQKPTEVLYMNVKLLTKNLQALDNTISKLKEIRIDYLNSKLSIETIDPKVIEQLQETQKNIQDPTINIYIDRLLTNYTNAVQNLRAEPKVKPA